MGESSTEDGLIGPIPVVTGNYDAIWSLQSGGSMVPVNASAIVGHYEVFYSLNTGGALVPRNSHARIGELRVCASSP